MVRGLYNIYMKKYIVFLFIFAFIFGLFNINFINAQDSSVEDCLPGDLFSRLTGERCSTITTPTECRPGHLFSSITGKPCKRTTPPIVCPIFKIGTKGENVRAFQAQLNAQGANLKLDGSYGPLTQSSALRYCKPPTGGPVISGISGSQTLSVNQQGTWTVKAYDSSGGTLSYLVNWGDDDNRQMGYNPSSMDTTTYQSATFTHSYGTAGTYTPTFYVTNSSGQRAQTSLSVNVGRVTAACALTAQVTNTNLSDSHTTWGFDIVVKAKNQPTGSKGWTAYFQGYVPSVTAYGKTKHYGNFFVSYGPLKFTAQDQVDNNCLTTITVYPPEIPSPSSVTVTSPNGGETWAKGTIQTIKWQDRSGSTCPQGTDCLVAGTSYDIFLNDLASCSENVCTTGFRVWTIAKGVSGLSYRWKIPDCSTVNTCPSNFDIPAGAYRVQVCQSGTSTCDMSDSYFKIVDDIPIPIPPIPIPIPVGTLYIEPGSISIGVREFKQVKAFYMPPCPSELACTQSLEEVDATWSVGNKSIADIKYETVDCTFSTAFTCESKTYVSVYGVGPGVTELTAQYVAAGQILTKTVLIYVDIAFPFDSGNL